MGFPVVVIGGGAAGIMASWRAAQKGAKVTLLEKTVRIGTKILVSGGGKCNICHDGDLKDVLRAYRPNEAQFLRPSFYKFTNKQVIEIFTSRGLEVYTRPDGRIFPRHQTARDVVHILRQLLTEVGVEIRYETPVSGLIRARGAVVGVQILDDELEAERVILATGGSSYPNSGTTGDGFRWASDVGHRVIPIRAALAPIYVIDPKTDLSGVSLQDVVLKARQNGKEIDRWRGALLWTHHGISGPCALAVSRVVTERLADGEVSLEVDFAQDTSFEELGHRVQVACQTHPKKSCDHLIEQILPERLRQEIFSILSHDASAPSGQLEKRLRNRLVELVKAFPIGKVKAVPMEKGEVVAGGVDLSEVDPQTLKSRLVEGLWICGEALDIAGPVGGYNLQAAWSTGYVAGESAASP